MLKRANPQKSTTTRSKRPAIRRRKYFRRNTKTITQRPANIRNTPIRVVREASLSNAVIPTGSSVVLYGDYFTLTTHCPNSAEFTALFDQYRLRTVIFKTRLIMDPSASGTVLLQQWYPDVLASVDHDDASPPASVEALRQYGKAKSGILKPNQWFTYKFHPTVAIQLYATATTTAYGPAKNSMWVDCAYDPQYYGLKVAYDGSAYGPQTQGWAFERRIVCVWEFKSTR